MSQELNTNDLMRSCQLLAKQLSQLKNVGDDELHKRGLIRNIEQTCWFIGIDPPNMTEGVS